MRRLKREKGEEKGRERNRGRGREVGFVAHVVILVLFFEEAGGWYGRKETMKRT